ncbi:MAG: HEAT repeat domain-containing protein [Candidatus ainarchaeum sp.]|nr:HEAT repeat domain-containing protein [Candidatus ainarchaeum sp.]
MPRETFGGDDDSGSAAPEQPKRKIPLSKFGLAPDVNIRDVFWRIMASYAATRKPGVELSSLEHDRFALMRAALSVLSNPHGEEYGLAPRFIATYTSMLLMEAGWKDAFAELLERGLEDAAVAKLLSQALGKLAASDEYAERLGETFSAMIRGKDSNAVAVAYLAGMKDGKFAARMKKELTIIARGDIGQNQLNAIGVISLMKDDPEVKRSLVALLSHWDEGARLAAAEALGAMAGDPEVKAAAKRRLAEESSQEIKKALERIAK